jgi:phosphate uptake regulator
MARIPTLEVQVRGMKALLQTMSDRVQAGLEVIERHLDHPDQESLIKLIVWDTEVDNLERAVDDTILQIFATQQPLAYYLRLAHAGAKIASFLERMGDAVESLARQLAARQGDAHKSVIMQMLSDTKDLFKRSYAAMFEGDLSQIQEIRILDDKVDAWQRELYFSARQILYESTDKSEVENALQLINIGTKLEKIADLCCNWAEQIDFAEHGTARRKLMRRKHRIAFMDDNFGFTASLAACYLSQSVGDLVNISVVTRSEGATISLLEFAEFFSQEQLTPQVFPIARMDSMQWNRTLMLVRLGNFDLDEEEGDLIPFKTVSLHWPEVEIGKTMLREFSKEHSERSRLYPHIKSMCSVIKLRTEALTPLLMRAQHS